MAGVSLTAALGLAVGPATAFAGGPDTSKQTQRQDDSRVWLDLQEGDRNNQVVGAKCILSDLDYVDSCDAAEDFEGKVEKYDADLTSAVERYQKDYELTVTGTVTEETWDSLSEDVGGVEKGDNRTDVVEGLQYQLFYLADDSPDIDGDFEKYTEAAVKEFQESDGIDANGTVDSATLKAMFSTDHAED